MKNKTNKITWVFICFIMILLPLYAVILGASIIPALFSLVVWTVALLFAIKELCEK